MILDFVKLAININHLSIWYEAPLCNSDWPQSVDDPSLRPPESYCHAPNAWIFQWIGTFFLLKTFLFTLVNWNSNLKNSSPLEIFPDIVKINLLCYVADPSETSGKHLYINLCVCWAFTRIDSHSVVASEYLACYISLQCPSMLLDT